MQNGKDRQDAGNAKLSEGEVHKKTVIEFETPQPPSLVATSPYQMTLLWKELQLKSSQQELQMKQLAVNFALLMKLVSSHHSYSPSEQPDTA